MMNNTSGKHNSGIDVLRGLAILSVILLHINIRIPFSGTHIGAALPPSIYKILFWSGYYGVCIFFVISGFLITTSAINKWGSLMNINMRGFYTMRFARIIPLLLALLIILSVLHIAGVPEFVINPNQTSLGRAIIAALTFHINWLEITTGYLPGSWDVLWSLSVEEVFYLFFPIVCILMHKEWHFVVIVVLFLIISPFARTVWFLDYGFADADHNHFAFLDAISLGCLAAIVAGRLEIKKMLLTGLGLSGLALMSLILVFRSATRQLHLGQTGLNVTILAIGTALVLIWMQKRFVSGKQKSMPGTVLLQFFGRNSYEVYLTHMFVVFAITETYFSLHLSGEWIWALYIIILFFSGILGQLVSQYFSSPLNRKLREKLSYNKKII